MHSPNAVSSVVSLRPLLVAVAPLAVGWLLGCSAESGGNKTDSAAVAATTSPVGGVLPGIEVLLTDSLHLIRGKRVGLITNHSGRNRAGTSTIDLLAKAPDVKLTALFGPEHGLRGNEEGEGEKEHKRTTDYTDDTDKRQKRISARRASSRGGHS